MVQILIFLILLSADPARPVRSEDTHAVTAWHGRACFRSSHYDGRNLCFRSGESCTCSGV